jgi:hypothetical protein
MQFNDCIITLNNRYNIIITLFELKKFKSLNIMLIIYN